ncbi:hypothetical protein ACQUQU_02190 [Thalassolituus sp. LLYu03]|uniref:hypothetical protein n=1 Tax=Thalassolituus sp. LLYu03 TaxID=3421656 RepID=UPI003D2B7DD6
MSENSGIPSPMQILAKVNAALESSGLKNVRAEREPLPLFWQLLNEWLSTQGIAEPACQSSAEAASMMQPLPHDSVREALHRIHREALQLSKAHLRLNDWSQRELENEYRTLRSLLEHKRPLPGVSGY